VTHPHRSIRVPYAKGNTNAGVSYGRYIDSI